MSRRPRLLIFIVAYQAASTIENVLQRIPKSLAEEYEVEVLIIDDSSRDATFDLSLSAKHSNRIPFKLVVLYNPVNQGYGGNQKIGYQYGIEHRFDYVALLHGDGQYAPEMLPVLAGLLHSSQAAAVFGSRFLRAREARKGGMPLYKFVGNRILTIMQNRLLGTSLSEFHSGYRLYAIDALRQIPFERNTNDFHFDTEIIIQLVLAEKRIIEHPIPTYYGDEICRVNGMRYAKDVMKASLQARLQRINLFYDRRFDCAPPAGASRYPSKLDFDSTHRRVLELVSDRSRVLDLGCGPGVVGGALARTKHCTVVGVDAFDSGRPPDYARFIVADLNRGIPDVGDDAFDYILALDIVEHLDDPEAFLDALRRLAARWPRSKVILATANIGFIMMRLSLLAGRFEYGKRGILDLTHKRLFTFATFRRTLASCGFVAERTEGLVPPLPFVFGTSRLSRILMSIARTLTKISPRLFAFQCLVVAKPRPTLETLVEQAFAAAAEKELAS